MVEITVDDRDSVRDHVEDVDWIHDVMKCGPGLIAVERAAKADDATAATQLLDDHGWYEASRVPSNGGDYIVLMPVTGSGE